MKCVTCSYRYKDGFCMKNCSYVDNDDKCESWTDKPIEFDYSIIYRLCKDYIKLCKDYKEYEEMCEKHPEEKSLEVLKYSYEFFFNCLLNDLHREMSLWETRR